MKVGKAVKASLAGKYFFLTASTGALAYIFFLAYSFPLLMGQMVSRNLFSLPKAIYTSSISLTYTAGVSNLVLTVIYTGLLGVTLTNVLQRLKVQGSGLSDSLSLLPGFLVAGCAGCGVGAVTFFGLAGALAAIPFSNHIVKIIGIGLMIAVLHRSGSPYTCVMDE
ncbi:MAG: hypothetical protein ABEJ93_02555 [Candidatus Nanohalobium sp.]